MFVPSAKSNLSLLVLLLVSIGLFIWVENSRVYVSEKHYEEKMAAANLMQKAINTIKDYRVSQDIFIDEVNDQNAKKVVLFLSKNREKEWTKEEIIKNCALPDDERQLEKKLRKLVKGDLIGEGSSSMRYKGMSDDIFYKVFRYRYQEEIDNFSQEEIEK